jgi:hypothetical protein
VLFRSYAACLKRLATGLMGSVMKTMLATKTIVYVGYSFTDTDFLKIHDVLTKEMKGLRPHSYIVTLDRTNESRFLRHDMTPIFTDGAYFLSIMKKHLNSDGQLLPDDAYDGIIDLLLKVQNSHILVSKLDLSKYPSVILTASYQDGFIHALERILESRTTGQYSHTCNTIGKIEFYDDMRRERLRERRYHDVAYIDGYVNGLIALLAPKTARKFAPILYVFGAKDHPSSIAALKRTLVRAPNIHKRAYVMSKRLVKERLGGGKAGVVFHHTPFLL